MPPPDEEPELVINVTRTPSKGAAWMDGQAVWPARNDRELKTLEIAAQQYGARIRVLAEEPQDCERPRGAEIVAALGAGWLLDEATVYANLTGREAIQITSLEEVKNIPDVRVIAVDWNNLSLAQMEELFSVAQRPGGVGLLLLSGGTDDRIQVLSRAIAAVCSGRRAGTATCVVPWDPSEDLKTGRIRYTSLASEDAGDALSSGTVLAVFGHSDGLDLELGAGRILCPMTLNTKEAARAPGVPHCCSSHWCTRTRLPLADALQQSKLVPTERVACSVAVLLTCFGLVCNDAVVSPRYGFVRQLVNNPRAGTIITSWDAVIPSEQDLRLVCLQLLAGETAGSVAQSMNVRCGSRLRLAVIGDPTVRASLPDRAFGNQAAELADALRPVGRRQLINLSDETSTWKNRLETLSAVLSSMRRKEGDLELFEVAERALGDAHASQPAAPAALQAVADCVLACVARRGLNLEAVTSEREVMEVGVQRKCFCCGRRLRIFAWVPWKHGLVRQSALCGRCAVVLNAEEGANIDVPFHITGAVVQIPDRLLTRVVRVAVVVRSPSFDQSGQLVDHSTGKFTIDLQPGLSDVHVFMILRQGELVIARQPVWTE